MSKAKSILPANLALLRKRRGLSQQEVSAQTGITKSSIQVYEGGRAAPKEAAIAKLASFYRVTTDELRYADLSQRPEYHIDPRRQIADNLLYLRESHGWSQYEISDRTGIVRSTYAQWELAQTMPSDSSLQKIAHACGVTLDELRNKTLRPKLDDQYISEEIRRRDLTIATQQKLITFLESEILRLKSRSKKPVLR